MATTIFTDYGQQLITEAIANKTTINITKIAVGDGMGAVYTPVPSQTALKRETWSGPIDSVQVNPTNKNQVTFEGIVGANVGGFYIREIGLYDQANKLVAISDFPESFKALADQYELYVRMILQTGSADVTNIIINKDMIYATKKYVDTEVAKKYAKPTTGIPKTDLSADVQTSLVKAESALQSVTKTDVGLSNVDNTSDADKPISNAQQAEFNKKANLASPVFTGTPTVPTASEATNSTAAASTAFVNRAVATHKADNTHIFNVDVTYATSIYTVANAPAFTDYLTVRFKAPNAIVDTATFKIGTDVYTMVNADFELNEIVIVTFDKVQKKVFFKRGSDIEPLLPSQLNTFTADKTGVSGQLKLNWTITDTTNLNDFLFVYKTTGYPESSKDGTAITASKDARTLLIDNLVDGTTYYIRAYPRNAKKQVQSSYKVASSSPRAADDVKRAPGPIFLEKGTMQEGYFGLVTSTELITGDSLASLVGLTAGTSQFSTTNWLKFAYKGKVLFVAQKPVRYNLSWDSINSVGAVMGTKQVAIKSLNYKVRLLKGALTNPSENEATDRGAKGSEWNRLMLAVHEQVKNKNWAYPAYVESDIQDFGTYFTDADLITYSSFGNGSYSWCQETTKSNSSYRVVRGYSGVSHSGWNTSSDVHAYVGWRPVLELI